MISPKSIFSPALLPALFTYFPRPHFTPPPEVTPHICNAKTPCIEESMPEGQSGMRSDFYNVEARISN